MPEFGAAGSSDIVTLRPECSPVPEQEMGPFNVRWAMVRGFC